MTAAGMSGLDGLVLVDAWNIAAGTSKGAVTRDELVRAFDDFGNSAPWSPRRKRCRGSGGQAVAIEFWSKRRAASADCAS